MKPYVLDTDTLSLYQYGDPVVCQQVDGCPLTDLAITVISVEEQLSGWYAQVRQAKQSSQMAHAYQRLADTVRVLGRLPILSYTLPAIQRYEQLRLLRLKIGKMDLRIAAIVLEHSGTLVTRN